MESASAIFETDWLASRPVFYHEKSGVAGYDIWQVIDFGSFSFHPEGLARYLEYGYAVFGQTPIQHVRFLPPNSRCIREASGKLRIEQLPDTLPQRLHCSTRVDDVLGAMAASVQGWEAATQGPLLLPLSGGLDSRFLLWLLKDKARVRAFTYGGAPRQEQSHEVVLAQALAKQMGVHWQHIELGRFHRFIDEWIAQFGPSTHAHGMYQMEFYTEAGRELPAATPVLSGIIGDAWAGSVEIHAIDNPSQLVQLGYSHGMHADASHLHSSHKGELAESFFASERDHLRDPLYRVVAAMRFKMMLLRYLLEVPQAMGFRPWTPFLTIETALSMLNLPASLRTGRQWQRLLFEAEGLNIEKLPLSFSRANTLNAQALLLLPPPPLKVNLLREIIDPAYVEWINRILASKGWPFSLYHQALSTPRVKGVMAGLGCRNYRAEAYAAYLTLKPLEQLIEKRDRL